MKAIHLRQNWKGIFTYHEGYETKDQYREVEFTMDITFTENSFVGISIDSESKKIFDRPASVKGFIEDEKISFIVKYPCAYFKDDDGQIVLDESIEHPDIHYLGFFDDKKRHVSGNWEMTVYEEKYEDGYLEEILNGHFEMRKLN